VSDLDDLVNNQRAFHLAYSNAMIDVGVQMNKMISLKNRTWIVRKFEVYEDGGRVGYLFGPANVKGRFNQPLVEEHQLMLRKDRASNSFLFRHGFWFEGGVT
jgi:hypothetical protein